MFSLQEVDIRNKEVLPSLVVCIRIHWSFTRLKIILSLVLCPEESYLVALRQVRGGADQIRSNLATRCPSQSDFPLITLPSNCQFMAVQFQRAFFKWQKDEIKDQDEVKFPRFSYLKFHLGRKDRDEICRYYSSRN